MAYAFLDMLSSFDLNVASENPLASSDKGTKEPVSSLLSFSLMSLSSFLDLFEGEVLAQAQ